MIQYFMDPLFPTTNVWIDRAGLNPAFNPSPIGGPHDSLEAEGRALPSESLHRVYLEIFAHKDPTKTWEMINISVTHFLISCDKYYPAKGDCEVDSAALCVEL
jgi:hypothetical protein